MDIKNSYHPGQAISLKLLLIFNLQCLLCQTSAV